MSDDETTFIYKGGRLSYAERNGLKPGTIVTVEDAITVIAERAFQDSQSIIEVLLHDKVERIGRYAFSECTKLETIHFPNGLKTIGEGAFFICESLKTIALDKTQVATIEAGAFDNCRKLETIDFPKGLKTIGELAFDACESLKTIKLPNGLKTIESMAFCYCKSLEKVEGLPNNAPLDGNKPQHVREIAENAFYETRLSEIHARENYNVRGINDDAKNTDDYLEYETYASALVKVVNTIEGSGANAAIGL